jgi:predicted TIM-barrel fold metal-dependent hydrolase
MDQNNVVLGMLSSWSPYIEQWKKAAPEKFLISSQILKRHLDDSEFFDQMREKCRSGEYRWIGEVVLQYWGISPNSPKAEPVFALAEELNVPVCFHVGLAPPGVFKSYPKYRAELSSALLLEDVLARHPNLRIWIAHAGWPMLDDMVALLHAYPQVYVDLGGINWLIPRKEFHAYLKRLVNAGFSSRIMFGSDQMYWPEAIGLAIEGVESAGFLTKEQKRDIFYNNAVRFFQLDENSLTRYGGKG